jgi:hypothetical protein
VLFLLAWLTAAAIAQADACGGEGLRQLKLAAERGAAFDLRGAADAYLAAAKEGCAGADLAGSYVQALAAARAAYAQGGSPESLAQVRETIKTLEAQAAVPGAAQIASLVLQAAAAGAQSERDQMSLLLDQAVRLERIQLEAKQPPLPIVSAHEAAGDLWLQVHGYEEARRAYEVAAQRTGRSDRVLLGLARVAVGLKDNVAACTHYRALVARWTSRPDTPPEILESRRFVGRPPCAAAVPRNSAPGR